MLRQHKKGLTFGSVRHGDTARVLLETGRTIETIAVRFKNITINQIIGVNLKLAGVDIISGVNGSYFIRQRTLKGVPNQENMFFIDFYDQNCDDQINRSIKCLSTFPTEQLILEIAIGSKVGDQANPELSYDVITSQPRPRVVVPKIKQHVWQIGLSGEAPYNDFVRGPRIEQIEFFTPFSTNLKDIKIKYNNFEVFNADSTILIAELEAHGANPRHSSLEGYSYFYPMLTGYSIDSCRTDGQQFEIAPNFANAGNIVSIFSTIESADNVSLDPLRRFYDMWSEMIKNNN
jgi:hypothetical protein